jgi:hypothetical protein
MKKLLPFLLSLSLLATPLFAAKPTTFLTNTWKSIVEYKLKINDHEAHCTAFAVRFDPPTYLTAAHCNVGVPGEIDGQMVEFVAQSNQILAIKVPNGKARPMLILGERPRAWEDTVHAYGIGGALRHPFIFDGRVLDTRRKPYDEETDLMMMFNQNFIGGMSGGPIVNEKGQLVSVVECGGMYSPMDAGFGCGANYDELSDMYRHVTARE